MEKREFLEYTRAVLDANGLSEFAGEAMLEGYYALTEELLRVNEYMNLTAIKDMKGIALKHIADSLMLLKFTKDARTVADVGCGAGFPSLPCAIAASHVLPKLRFFGFDSTRKRVDYVNATAEKLGLSNIKAYFGRAEDFGRRADFRERFDIVSARAVSEMYILSELCLPLTRVGGRMVALKGQRAEEELLRAASHIPNIGGSSPILEEYTLLDGEGGGEYRAAVICEKKKPTSDIFPRAYSKITASAKKL